MDKKSPEFKMKKTLTLTCIVLMLAAPAAFARQQVAATGCDAKAQHIQRQLEHARAHGNTNRAAGLEKALYDVNANCTDAGLKAEREAKVRDKQQKVNERRQELAEAKADGRAEKISKKQQKLNKAEDELREAQAELSK